MPTPSRIKEQVDRIIRYLVEVGLSSDQNFAIQRGPTRGRVEITFWGAGNISKTLKDCSYSEIYEDMVHERAYNVKLPDGALLQMLYEFNALTLMRHRLAFFPAPHLEEFQNNPEIYLEEEIYADVVAKTIVPFPLRFDFDSHEGTSVEIEHPKSHLTLGQYENCRIPVTAPLTPFWFVDFILRNFYHTAYLRYADKLPQFKDVFEDSILPAERNVVHIQIPFGA